MTLPVAYVTSVCSVSSVPGALNLANSLKCHNCNLGKFVVLIPQSSSELTRYQKDLLLTVYDELIYINNSKFESMKIHIFNLEPKFDKILYLDPDTLVLQNIDHLFDLIINDNTILAAPDCLWPDNFDTGVMLIKPNENYYQQLNDQSTTNDKDLFNEFFTQNGKLNQDNLRVWEKLSFLYNVTPTPQYEYAPACSRFSDNIKIIHYISDAKPWLDKSSYYYPNDPNNLNKLWWDHWISKYGSEDNIIKSAPTINSFPDDYDFGKFDPITNFSQQLQEANKFNRFGNHKDLVELHNQEGETHLPIPLISKEEVARREKQKVDAEKISKEVVVEVEAYKPDRVFPNPPPPFPKIHLVDIDHDNLMEFLTNPETYSYFKTIESSSVWDPSLEDPSKIDQLGPQAAKFTMEKENENWEEHFMFDEELTKRHNEIILINYNKIVEMKKQDKEKKRQKEEEELRRKQEEEHRRRQEEEHRRVEEEKILREEAEKRWIENEKKARAEWVQKEKEAKEREAKERWLEEERKSKERWLAAEIKERDRAQWIENETKAKDEWLANEAREAERKAKEDWVKKEAEAKEEWIRKEREAKEAKERKLREAKELEEWLENERIAKEKAKSERIKNERLAEEERKFQEAQRLESERNAKEEWIKNEKLVKEREDIERKTKEKERLARGERESRTQSTDNHDSNYPPAERSFLNSFNKSPERVYNTIDQEFDFSLHQWSKSPKFRKLFNYPPLANSHKARKNSKQKSSSPSLNKPLKGILKRSPTNEFSLDSTISSQERIASESAMTAENIYDIKHDSSAISKGVLTSVKVTPEQSPTESDLEVPNEIISKMPSRDIDSLDAMSLNSINSRNMDDVLDNVSIASLIIPNKETIQESSIDLGVEYKKDVMTKNFGN